MWAVDLGMLPFSNFDSSYPVFGERKRLSVFAAKDSAIFTPTWFTTNNNKFPTFRLFFKDIISWEIRALKQYPLITKEVWIVLEAISKTCASCLTAVSRHLETIKALGCFICFSVSGYPGQTLELVFDLLHETSDIYIYNIWRIRRLHCSITMKLSYLVSPPCKQLSSYLIMASSNVWIPPFNDLDEREFRFVLGSGNVSDFINSGVDLYKILPNPDKFDTVCKYYIH